MQLRSKTEEEKNVPLGHSSASMLFIAVYFLVGFTRNLTHLFRQNMRLWKWLGWNYWPVLPNGQWAPMAFYSVFVESVYSVLVHLIPSNPYRSFAVAVAQQQECRNILMVPRKKYVTCKNKSCNSRQVCMHLHFEEGLHSQHCVQVNSTACSLFMGENWLEQAMNEHSSTGVIGV